MGLPDPLGLEGTGLPGQGTLEGAYDWLTPDAQQTADPMFRDAALNQERNAAALQGQQSRGAQGQLAQMLLAQAQGKGPSVAQAQLERGRNEGMAGAMSMQASARGGNPALAARTAQQAQAQIAQNAAGQAAELRAKEMMAARGQLGEQLNAIRGQDIGMQGLTQQQQQALLQAQSQVGMANTQAATQNQGGILGAAGGILGGVFSDVNAKTGREPGWGDVGFGLQQAMQPYQAPAAGVQAPPPPENKGLLSSIFSDKETKEIRGQTTPREREMMLEMLRSGTPAPPSARFGDVQTERYQYRPGFEPPNRMGGGVDQYGPNAQALASAPDPALRNLVARDPRTGMLQIDGARAGAVALGMEADRQREIDMMRAQLADLQSGAKRNRVPERAR